MSAFAVWLKSRPDGSLLRFVLHGMIGFVAVMLVTDLRAIVNGTGQDPYITPAVDPVRMERPAPDDQIRPYLPHTRPLAPGDPLTARPQGENEASPMRFRLGTHGAAFADGTIVPGTADALEAFLATEAAAGITELVLHSPGGSVQDATEMARLIREKNLGTRILPDGYCASSCPLVFAGGVGRIAAVTSWVGVHQVFALTTAFGSLAEGMDQGQRVSAEALKLLAELGVDPLLWTHAMETPRDRLYLFTPEEMLDLKLATEIDGRLGVPAS